MIGPRLACFPHRLFTDSIMPPRVPHFPLLSPVKLAEQDSVAPPTERSSVEVSIVADTFE